MKKLVFIFVAFTVQICLFAQEYFPEGTKWTEIRLDTLKFDSWYSKVGEEWMPNFETIEYYVKGNYIDRNKIYKKVYTNGSEWTDSLALLIYDNGYDNKVSATVLVHDFNLDSNGDYVPWPGETYQFDWSVREGLYYCDIMESNSTGAYPYYYYFGMINEIKEGDFGGVRPMRYVDLDGKAPYDPQNPGNTDTNGARIIQGIGVTEWNDGECIFGPVKPYEALSFWGAVEYEERHYRSMLVHFERDGEVLYDVWPKKEEITHQPLPFLEGNPIWVYKYEKLGRAPGWKNGVLYGCFVDTGDREFFYYFLGGQKEIDGKVYTMVGEIISRGEDELTVNRWLPVREENGIVYTITDSLPGLIEDFFNKDNIPYQQVGNECVLFNFNKKIGETIYPQNNELKVESYGTYQLMDGTVCRVLKTIDEEFYLYEKLGYLYGSPYGIMGPPYEFVYTTGGDVFTTRLNAYFGDNVMLYKVPDTQEGLCVNDTCWSRDDAYIYVSSYKADPRHEEVMAYIRQLQTAEDPVTFTAGQMATIILPTEPDASKGKYYKLDRCEDGQIVFAQELLPQARTPYIIVPNQDFSVEVKESELEGLNRDSVSIGDVTFIGSYVRTELPALTGGAEGRSFYIDIIDTTPDCGFAPLEETGKGAFIGALRAYLTVHWDDPYSQTDPKGVRNKLEIVLLDYGTNIDSLTSDPSPRRGEIYDLSGRMFQKIQKGVNIVNGKKVAVK